MPRVWIAGLLLLVACDDATPAAVDAAVDVDAASVDAALIDAGSIDAAGFDAAPFTIGGEVNLTTAVLSAGRTCGEAPQYAVTGLSATSATLATAPVDDCLAAFDEVLLINLQGTPEASVNVGQWELLEVASVADHTVTFRAAKARSYGSVLDSDSGIGTGASDQKVVLVRVPRYGALTIAADAVVTAEAWNGNSGGVLALRADSIQVDGTLSAARLGYRGGRWSQDGGDCTQNIPTEAGESISGPAVASATANSGGAGGTAAADGPGYNANSPISPSAGHATAGEPGQNANGRTLGEPGQAYGQPGAARLTMGSGAPGNLTCTNENSFPILSLPPSDHRAGGIVVVLANRVTVAESGAVSATPVDAVRDTASSGGYVYLRGATVDVGDERVTARGSKALSVNGPAVGMFNLGSVGYIAIGTSAPLVGQTSPAASVVP